MSKVQLKALFQKIGGEPQLAKILEDFYRRMSEDILIGYFFTGKDISHIADRQKQFLLAATGLNPSYTGKSPTTAHVELPPILSGHFDRRLRILEETLRAHGVDETDIGVWVGFENAFRKVVVEG
jgi:hemoglobin